MKIEEFTELLGADFYTGVPDSQLRALCDYLMVTYGTDPKHHMIAANEGNCAGIAAGYHLATGKVPAVYLQNSGEGNIINPLASLLNSEVYSIPCIFVIGWRGEPGVHDEPQHIFQGKVTLKLLEVMDVQYTVVGPETTTDHLQAKMQEFHHALCLGKQVALIIQKNALTYEKKPLYRNEYNLLREDALQCIVKASGEDVIVCTTGKAGRELFELREKNGQGHEKDFLTVGSMGHCSSIAVGIALQQPRKRVWCIDGDGAMLMHLGALPVIASCRPQNLVHVVIHNGAHESVGGQPNVMNGLDACALARASGYPYTARVDNLSDLSKELKKIKDLNCLSFLEVKSAIGSRKDLGRPTTKPLENKQGLMEYLNRYRGE